MDKALLYLFLVSFLRGIEAYVPAQPTNDTNTPSFQGILPSNQPSNFEYEWYIPGQMTPGSNSALVSYQLAGAGTTGLSQGALVHFAEIGNMSNQSASDFSTFFFPIFGRFDG